MAEEQKVVEVTPRTARRQFTKAFKRDLVEQALRPDVSMAAVAIANELNTNQLARWCREHLKAQGQYVTPSLIPVRVMPVETVSLPSTSAEQTATAEIEWHHGQNVIIVRGAAAHEGALRLLLTHLKSTR